MDVRLHGAIGIHVEDEVKWRVSFSSRGNMIKHSCRVMLSLYWIKCGASPLCVVFVNEWRHLWAGDQLIGRACTFWLCPWTNRHCILWDCMKPGQGSKSDASVDSSRMVNLHIWWYLFGQNLSYLKGEIYSASFLVRASMLQTLLNRVEYEVGFRRFIFLIRWWKEVHVVLIEYLDLSNLRNSSLHFS